MRMYCGLNRPRERRPKKGPAKAGGTQKKRARRGGPFAPPKVRQFWLGVFSAKYSWLSALLSAWSGFEIARFLAPAWP
jgi:hypothetical protein